MTPIYQRDHDDCFRCCIASVLDWPYEEVPHFMSGIAPGPMPQRERDGMDGWFAIHGLVLLRLPLPVESVEQARTVVAACQPPVNYILSGRTRKGVSHAVVCFDTHVAHDPARPSQPIYEPHENGVFWSFFIGLR